jgi:hypothetical protein
MLTGFEAKTGVSVAYCPNKISEIRCGKTVTNELMQKSERGRESQKIDFFGMIFTTYI